MPTSKQKKGDLHRDSKVPGQTKLTFSKQTKFNPYDKVLYHVETKVLIC